MSDDPYKAPESKPEASATIFWSYRSLPELSGLSRAEQKAAWQACYTKAYGHWQFWLGFGLVVIICTAIQHPVDLLIRRWFDFDQPRLIIIGKLVFLVPCLSIAMTHVQIRYTRPHLRAFLDSQQVDE
jgi:hypothetical protein